MNDEPKQDDYTRHLLQDANDRLRFQHEYALGAFRTLILINGGAIVGLLTYAGNVLDQSGARSLTAAFFWYVGALAATVVAYLFAYISQGLGMNLSVEQAILRMGIADDPEKLASGEEKKVRWVQRWINLAIFFVGVALFNFVAGSVAAMWALT